MEARGELRDQYHHVSDIVPTILDCCGLTMPDIVDGVRQTSLAGVSMRYCFDDAHAPRRELVHYAMLGSRGLWHRGWKAVSAQQPAPRQRGQEGWQLLHSDVDRSESIDLAERFPERLESLAQLWFREARQHRPQRTSWGGPASHTSGRPVN
jgi:arylsulfatase A-like enzyme